MAMVFVAIAIGAFLKGITGLGLPVVALPVLSYLLGLPHAISVLMLPILLTNLHQSVQTRTAWREATFLWPGLVTGAVGLSVGTWILNVIDPNKLNIGLGLMLFVYIGLRIFSPQFALADRSASRLAPLAGFLGGFAQGSTGLCAAVIVPFLQSTRMSRTAIVFTISSVFLIFSIVQFVTFLIAGLIKSSFLVEGVLALIPVMLFMPLGGWISPRLPKKIFDRVFLVVLAVVAIGLIEKGL
ncbi:sulfite exporter TauE/SafE family protein [Shinella sp. BYT-45]|uniref:sulfite exporter TauE/SafE family protein n=1 Tax=Shinella sp. BYT-45 TaxID=3377377 RepID=UPI00397F3053